MPRLLIIGMAAAILVLLATNWAYKNTGYDMYLHEKEEESVQLGPRPFYLINKMNESSLKQKLEGCKTSKFKRVDFSIGHRGASLQFPEHTQESYEAAAKMGAGILECDVNFTKDKELVCRHSQCDLQTTTNILETELANRCSQPFQTAVFDADGNMLSPATAQCCTSDITIAEFKTLKGKMDAFNPSALTVEEYMGGTPGWRTDLYASNGTLLTHKESITLFLKLGTKMIPELKTPSVSMPFDDFSQQDYAQKIIDEYKEADIPASKVWVQSSDIKDILYWIQNEPEFASQAVYLDGRYDDPDFDHRNPATWSPSMDKLIADNVQIIAPPMWMLLDIEDEKIIPSLYANKAREVGLDIITWTLERSGPLVKGGGWYYQTLNGDNPDPMSLENSIINNDGNTFEALHVLAQDIGILGIFSDWPATVTYYANCMGIK